MHLRNLPVLAALFAVAPLSAHQRPASVAQPNGSACPYERAAAQAAQASQATVAIEAAPEGSLFGVGLHSPAYLP
jgi:hypothetical protein